MNQETWQVWLSKQSFTAILVLLVLWWVSQYLILPLRDANQEFISNIVKSNSKHVEVAEQNAKTNQQNAVTLTKMADTQSQQAAAISEVVKAHKDATRILEQIRDDQRSGAWNNRSKVESIN